MLQSKRNTVLVLYLIALCLIGPLIFWLSYRSGRGGQSAIQQPINEIFNSTNKNPALQKRISLGNKLLVTADNNPDKQAGVQAFAAGDFSTAVAKFNMALQVNRNDPEAWIYLDNASAAAISNTIKIGVSVPIGGNLNVAREILRGVAQAQYEVNHSGGIGGKLIQVQIANDDNNPIVAKQVAAEFVKDPNILAVVGHNASDPSVAAAPIYQKGGLTMVSPTSYARSLSEAGKYIFRTTPSARAMADTLAAYTVQSLRKKRIAICADSTAEASRSLQEEFTSSVFENGGYVTSTACDFANPSFNPGEIPSQAISDGADALLLAPSVNGINRAIEVAQANRGRLTLLSSHTMYTFATLQQGQADINGMLLAVPWHPGVYANSPFIENAKRFWGGTVNWRTALTYDAAMAIFTGLKSGASREQLQKGLANSGFMFKGATGVVNFLPSGDRNLKATLVKIQSGTKSGVGYEFVPLQP